ncbi:MAG TPA: redoxin domain-containing protein [Cytophagaceae bacterium]|nr:redoxin domain-containing protein [Cytophagaceae bacterium]
MKFKSTYVAIYCTVMFCFCIPNFSNAQTQFTSSIDKRKKSMLPKFSYQTLDERKFTNENLDKNMRLLIIYFNPLCEVCQRETADIIDNINFFQDIQIVMVSPAHKEDVNKFVKKFKINNYHQITVLHDKDDVFYKQFGAIGYPTLYLYNKKKELIENYDTEVQFEDIKDSFGAEVASGK